MVSRSVSESAFTTDTPTPCRPPETLYVLESNLPPACSSVITISAAERLSSSSSLMPVGMPRPLSITDTELSVWMVTTISSQNPARASSTALSTTSNTMWCRPVPSEVSPMYIPGRLRTASRPFRTLMASEPYSWPPFPAALPFDSVILLLDPLGHDDVLEILLALVADECAGGSVAESALHLRARHVVQYVEQVVDVEADVERVAAVLHLELFLRLFLLGVGRHDLEHALGEHPAHAAELLVGEDRGARQRLAQRLARGVHLVLVPRRDDPRVVRELG